MPERGFVPVPSGERRTLRVVGDTLIEARSLIKRQSGLGLLLAVSFVFGLHSEGLTGSGYRMFWP